MILFQIDCQDDISDSIEKKVMIRHQRTATVHTNAADFLTDGRDGILVASFSSEQLAQAGTYDLQAFIHTINDEKFYGKMAQFQIQKNIGD